MFQGTGSDVGKSLIVAGLCRAYARRGMKVRPFKPQNMSNNAAVTHDGGEIGRAQALQARACFAEPSLHMNPVLLKPQSEIGAQIVVQGRVIGAAKARDYQALKPKLMGAVLESYAKLKGEADLILVEGAGSAAEINLREGDIANMGFARAAGCPVVLIGDIDRGGIFAQILGTKAALAPEDAATIVGFIVNKFRGDASLFTSGMATLAERTGWRAFGLAPFFPPAARLPAEDAFGLSSVKPRTEAPVTIAVPMLARIANFDDFDPLKLEPGVRLVFAPPGEPLPVADLIILPGSKATIADLADFRQQGWPIDLMAHVRRGGKVLGLCGGYQMLGTRVADPEGIEGPAGAVEGLGLLDVETVAHGREDASTGRGRMRRSTAPRSRATRCMSGGRMARTAPGLSCVSPRVGSTGRSRPTGGSRAPMCTGFSPTTASAPPGSLRSAQGRSWSTRRRSSARSTSLPLTLARISISTPCSAPRDKDRQFSVVC